MNSEGCRYRSGWEVYLGLPLAKFVEEVEADIKAFAAEYQALHDANPGHYPLTLEDDNAGLWMEFFCDFMTRRKDNGNAPS